MPTPDFKFNGHKLLSIMDMVLDVVVTCAGTIGAPCKAIAGANVVTLKDKMIKKMLLPPMSVQH